MVIIVFVTAGLLEYARRETLTGIIKLFSGVIPSATSTLSTMSTSNFAVFSEVNGNIELAQFFVYGSVVVVSILVAFIATRLALNPVRDSLITQKRFIASVAHELRTPLAILKTQNEVAKLSAHTPELMDEICDQNVEEIDHVTEILNNLLLFNRVDTLESITFDAVNLEAIIETVVSRLKILAEMKGVVVTFEKTVIPHVYGNATGLEQMLFNLVKNGVSYTHRGGEVVIKCISITEQEVTLRIGDNGMGIAKNELPHIFEPFYRTDRVQEMSSGTGLGLALVFEIIKLHNGKIKVVSAVGEGTQFDVTLPRQQMNIIQNKAVHEIGVAYDFSHLKGTGL